MRGNAELETPDAGVVTTCGLVLHLSEGPGLLESVRLALQAVGGCEAGEANGRWLPVAVETADPLSLQAQLEAIPGVERCEVVFIGSEDGLAPLAQPSKKNRYE
jgi:hypothetical protein